MLSYDIVINREHRLSVRERPKDLIEPDIVFAPDAQGERRLMRRQAAYWLERLFMEAEQQGIMLAGVSAYRSYERQKEIYEESLKRRGAEHTRRYIAPPGGSEHQSGLAIDVSCADEGYELEESFAQTREGIWLARNASLYGYVIRYPKGKEHITGYGYEPWHIRYVTKPLAFYLTKMQIVLEEYKEQVACREDALCEHC